MTFWKGLPNGRTLETAEGLSLLADELMLPAAIIRERALANNVQWMQRFTERLGLSLAPHGKTSMSPELFRRQMEAGAWGITASTAHHVRRYVGWGIRRIIVANQIVGRANLDALLGEIAAHADLDLYLLADSIAGMTQLADRCRALGTPRPVQVLIEIGGERERTGVRSLDAVLELACACNARPELALRGIEAFEGVYADRERADALLGRMKEAVDAVAAAGLFAPGEVIVSAGGSALFDLAATALRDVATGAPVRRVLRSGCYVTHDSRLYEEAFEAARQRMPMLDEIGRLQNAIEVWAHVQSRPEPSRVIASMGRRDVGHDQHMPRPLWRFRPGEDERPIALEGASVAKIYDQHACLDVPDNADLRIGDLVGFGVSHPCTTFDKHGAIFLVDDDYRVIGTVGSHFT